MSVFEGGEIFSLGSSLKIVGKIFNKSPGAFLLQLDGYLDNENTPRFLDFAQKALDESRIFGLDLGSLSYISSTGVGAFSSLSLESRQQGKYFFLTAVPEHIVRVINLLGFKELLPVVENPESYDFEKHFPKGKTF